MSRNLPTHTQCQGVGLHKIRIFDSYGNFVIMLGQLVFVYALLKKHQNLYCMEGSREYQPLVQTFSEMFWYVCV